MHCSPWRGTGKGEGIGLAWRLPDSQLTQGETRWPHVAGHQRRSSRNQPMVVEMLAKLCVPESRGSQQCM